MVDKTDGTERPHLPIYEVMLFEGSSDVMLCDQQRYLVCVERKLIQPREEEVSLEAQIHTGAMLTLLLHGVGVQYLGAIRCLKSVNWLQACL